MKIQEWIEVHKNGFDIGNLVSSEYVTNYMIIRYYDWFICDYENNPLYGIWSSYVSRNLNRLTAYYSELFERKNYDFGYNFSQLKSSNTVYKKDGGNDETKEYINDITKNIENKGSKGIESDIKKDASNTVEYTSDNTVTSDKDSTVTNNMTNTNTPNTTTTHVMGEWEESVTATDYIVAINSYTEKETNKKATDTTQPETTNTDKTTGSVTDVKEDKTVSSFNDKTTTDITDNTSTTIDESEKNTTNETSTNNISETEKNNANENRKNEYNENGNTDSEETIRGYNGKTQSTFLAESFAEFDIDPINAFIDKFVRGYFILG